MKHKRTGVVLAIIVVGLAAWQTLKLNSGNRLKFSSVDAEKLIFKEDSMRILIDLPAAVEFADLPTNYQIKLFLAATGSEIPQQASGLHGKYRNTLTSEKEPLGAGGTSFLVPPEIADQLFEKVGARWKSEATPDERIAFSDISSDATKINFGHYGRSILINRNESMDSYSSLTYDIEKNEMSLSYCFGNQ
jgi:hypothetical protein